MKDTSNKETHIELSSSNNNYKEKEEGFFMNALTPSANTKVNTIKSMLDKMQSQLLRALPKHLTPERMSRIALTEFQKIPKFMEKECDLKSFCGAIMQCSQLGLEPAGALGQVYLIPFENKKKLHQETNNPIIETQVMLGYKGMLELARRSGQIVSLQAQAVYDGDFFEYEYGLNEKLRHVPADEKKGQLKRVFALAKFVGGGYQFEVMSKSEVDKIREKSANKNSLPWINHYEEMARKTVLRRLFKYLPISIEKLQQAIALDEAAEAGIHNTMDVLEEEGIVFDQETGEIFEHKKVSQTESLAEKIK